MSAIKSLRNKYQGLSLQARASLWFVICSILQKGISFITVPIFARLMTKEQYGYYNTYISWYSILLVFTSMSLFYGVFNNAMLKFKDDKQRYVSSMQGLVTVLTLFCFIVYLLVRPWANDLLGMNTPLILLLFTELLVTPALQFWSAYNRFEFKYQKIVAITIIKSIANPVLGIILVLLSEDKATARIISTVIVEVIVCGGIASIQFLRGKCFFDKVYWKYAFLFNLPLIPHYLSGQILNQSDRIMIGRMIDNSAVAMYSIAYSIGLLMNIFTQAINGSYTPWFYQTLEKKDYSEIKKITNMTALLMFFLVILLMLFAPEAMYVIGGSKYKEAVYVIPPVAASVFFTFMYNIYANVEFYFEKTKFVLIGSLIAAICNLVLNSIFIGIFGYIAAAYTTLFCYMLYCFLHQLMARRVCRQNGVPNTIFDVKWIAALSIIVVIIGVGMSALYLSTLTRYLIIIAISITALIMRRHIKELIKGTIGVLKKK